MLKNLNLAPVAILLGATNAATWNTTDELFCSSDNCNSDINGNSVSYFDDASRKLLYWQPAVATVPGNNCDEYAGGICPKLAKGRGGCDADSDCDGNLVCGLRYNYESLPGITDVNSPRLSNNYNTNIVFREYNYCYDPTFQVYSELPTYTAKWDEYTQYDMNTTIQENESYISRIKFCQYYDNSGFDSLETTTLIEWDLTSMCEGKKESSGLYVGDHSYLASDCHEITLDESDCINDFTTFYYQGFVLGFGYNTTLGKSGVVTPLAALLGDDPTWDDMLSYQIYNSYISSIRSPLGSARVGYGDNNETQTCLTSIGIAEQVSNSGNVTGIIGGIVNVELLYNSEIPTYNSSTCKPVEIEVDLEIVGDVVAAAIGILITFVILGVCCCCGICLAIWFFCFRRTGSAGSLNANNQRPSTPEKQNGVQTTTIVQQPAMMAPVMTQQPQVMQMQPMQMQR